MNDFITLGKEEEDVQSYGEDGKQLDAALAELRAVEQDRRDAPRLDYYVDLAERANKEDRGGAGEPNARVDLQDFDFGSLRSRLADERHQRDQEDAERAERDAERARGDRERQARPEAERRKHSDTIRFASTLDDEADQRDGDDFDFDF